MMFMLSAKEKRMGYLPCPMIGFDPEAIKQILNIEQYEVVLMITIEKEKTKSRRPRGYRKPINEYVTFF